MWELVAVTAVWKMWRHRLQMTPHYPAPVRKHLPNILLLTVILVNLGFMMRYIFNNGLGMFISVTGFVLLVTGVIIFIFFLSIDPGYGWIRSMDLTRNYIMIFLSMGVCFFGLVLVVTGDHLTDLQVQAEGRKERCRQLLAGNGPAILKQDWYSLRDQHTAAQWNAYLFQNKGDRNLYKVIATCMQPDQVPSGSVMTVHSEALSRSVSAAMDDTICPGVLERDISIEYERHQALGEHVRFDIRIRPVRGERNEELVRLQLENKPVQGNQGEEAAAGSASEFNKGGLRRVARGTTAGVSWPAAPVSTG